MTDLQKRFGPTVALAGLDLRVPRGSFFGLFGRNGAGKTTTFDIVTGLTARDRGHVTLLGESFGLEPSPETKRRFAYIGGHIALYGTLTLRRHLEIIPAFYPDWDQARCDELLHVFKVPLDQPALGLSPGVHLQFQLVMALARSPEFLIIDEPGNLDPVVRMRLMASITEIVRAGDVTVMMASHLLDELQDVCDEMCIIDQGRSLVAGRPDKLTAPARVIRLHGVKATNSPDLGGICYLDMTGSEWRAVMAAYDERQAQALVAQVQAESWEAVPAGLQEFFIALTTEGE